MKRLYYLTKNITAVEQASARLHEIGITDWNFHVLGKDKSEVIRHHLHSAHPLQELDVIRSGERGVLAGFMFGVLVALLMTIFLPVAGMNIHWLAQAGAILLFSGFGAWIGGLIGVSSENYKIRRFHDEIEAGYLLLMVDVKPKQRTSVEYVIGRFEDISPAGEDTTIVTPFSEPVAH